MNEHITSEQAARWVAGLCDDEASTALERHIAACAPCTKLVEREAVAEQVLAQAVATLPENVVALRPRRRVAFALVVAAVAMAAALVVLLRPAPLPPPVVVEPMTFVVIEAADEPPPVMGVPRYEDGVALPMIAATAYEPFPL